MSVMSAFCGSLGSSSPNARPVSVSYRPALPKLGQTGGVPVQNAGDVLLSITILVTLASAVGAHAMSAAIARTNHVVRCRMLISSYRLLSLWQSGGVGWGGSLPCGAGTPA